MPVSSLAGDWEYYPYGYTYHVTQDSSGNLSGELTVPGCTPNDQWPIAGTISGGAFSFTITNPGCENSPDTSGIYNGTVGVPGCNYVWGTSISYPSGNTYNFGVQQPYPTEPPFLTKAVDVPTSETSKVPPASAWDTSRGAPWSQTLAPNSPPGEFEDRGVYEYGNGLGSDTCWFQGSKFAVFNTITTPGFAWTVGSKNTWGADFIGWSQAAVDYYRNQKKAPCGTRFSQLLVIDAAYSPNNHPAYSSYLTQSGELFYGVSYETEAISRLHS